MQMNKILEQQCCILRFKPACLLTYTVNLFKKNAPSPLHAVFHFNVYLLYFQCIFWIPHNTYNWGVFHNVSYEQWPILLSTPTVPSQWRQRQLQIPEMRNQMEAVPSQTDSATTFQSINKNDDQGLWIKGLPGKTSSRTGLSRKKKKPAQWRKVE